MPLVFPFHKPSSHLASNKVLIADGLAFVRRVDRTRPNFDRPPLLLGNFEWRAPPPGPLHYPTRHQPSGCCVSWPCASFKMVPAVVEAASSWGHKPCFEATFVCSKGPQGVATHTQAGHPQRSWVRGEKSAVSFGSMGHITHGTSRANSGHFSTPDSSGPGARRSAV